MGIRIDYLISENWHITLLLAMNRAISGAAAHDEEQSRSEQERIKPG
ncbi:MAG: hypothetical protein LUO92_00165 [Methanothrix sp.]|nr:hypothetical protein [Methanothrix sp.]